MQSGNKITTYTEGFSYEQFIEDERTIDAVIRNFEIIDESANRLSSGFKNTHEDIDWTRIKGFGNRIVHEYFGVDYNIAWLVMEDFLPNMLEQLEKIV